MDQIGYPWLKLSVVSNKLWGFSLLFHNYSNKFMYENLPSD
ncbi:hypothetical protein [Alkaliphilus serpentinus]|nr:hypothetical protein [Alkaliphilus serpentinus]